MRAFLSPDRRWRLQIALAAFVGISFQLCGFRAVSFYLDNSLQSVTFTLCLYFGGLLSGVWLLRFTPRPFAARVAASAAVFLGVFLILALTRFDLLYSHSLTWNTSPSTGKLLVSGLLLFPAALANGVLLPGLYALQAEKDRAFTSFLTTDLLGSIAACIWIGFVGLPYLGLPATLILSGCLSLLLAAWLFPATILVGGTALLGHWLLLQDVPRQSLEGAHLIPSQSVLGALTFLGDPAELTLVKSVWSSHGQLSIVDSPSGLRALVLNRRILCAIPPPRAGKTSNTSEDAIGRDTLQAFAAAHPKIPLSVANVGLGCGITVKSLLDSPQVGALDVIEINPDVVSLLPFFEKRVGLQQADPRLNVLIIDAADFFIKIRNRYHAIVIDVEEPSIPYSSPLYAQHFLVQAKLSLLPGGILSLWNPSGVSDDYLAILYATLRSQFGVVYVKTYGGGSDPLAPLQSAVVFFASDQERVPEAFGLKDSDLALTSRLAHRQAPPNTSANMALLRQWNRDQWSSIWK